MSQRYLVVALNLEQSLFQFLHLLGELAVLVSAVSQQLSQINLNETSAESTKLHRAPRSCR